MPSSFQRWSLLRFALCRARSSLSTGSTSFENNDTLQWQVLRRKRTIYPVKYYWEIIADNLSKAGWSLGCVSAIDFQGRTIWIVDAHRDGKRFVVGAEWIHIS